MNAALLASLQKQARDLLDEQRDAAGAFVTPSTTSLESACATRVRRPCADVRAPKRGKRDGAVMRTQAPGRAKLRSRRRDEKEWRLHTAVGERSQEVEGRRVGPLKILEGDDQRVGISPQPEPQAVIAASCLRRISSGGKLATRLGGSGMSRSGATRGVYSAGSRPINRNVL